MVKTEGKEIRREEKISVAYGKSKTSPAHTTTFLPKMLAKQPLGGRIIEKQ